MGRPSLLMLAAMVGVAMEEVAVSCKPVWPLSWRRVGLQMVHHARHVFGLLAVIIF